MLRVLFGTAFLALLLPPIAQPQESRTLVRVQGGLDAVETPIIAGLHTHGFTMGAGLEHRWSKHYGLVAQAQFRRLGSNGQDADIGGAGPWSVSATAALRVAPLGEGRRVTPYVTAGMGSIYASWRRPSALQLDGGAVARETALALPLAAGVSVRLGKSHISSVYVEAMREFTNTSSVFPHGLTTHGIRIGVHAGT